MPTATAAPRGRVDYSQVDAEILSRLDLREFFVRLGVQFTRQTATHDGWLECRAVGRDDAKPSAGCHLASGRYKDFARGDNLSLWEFAAAYGGPAYGSDWRAAREAIAKEVGVSLPEATDAPFRNLTLTGWNAAAVDMWLQARGAGISPAALLAAGGTVGRYRNRYSVIAVPVCGPSLSRVAPIGWVMWGASGRDLPVYERGNKEPREWVKMKTVGKARGLIILGSPSAVNAWKVEGPTDAMALWSAIPDCQKNAHVILTNADGASAHPDPWRVGAFGSAARVFVVGDADTPGQLGAEKWARAIAGSGRDTRLVSLPYEVSEKSGRDLRDYLTEHSFAEMVELAAASPKAIAGESPTLESPDDPHRLARLFLSEHFSAKGRITLRHWQEQWYAWSGQCYRRISDSYLRSRFTATIKREFDRLSSEQPPNDKEPPSTIKVTRNIVGNAMQALHSLCALPDDCEAPAWLGDKHERASREILVCSNGWIDLAGVRDNDGALPLGELTPSLWIHNAVPYAYEPAAVVPSRWLDFLCNQWHNGETSDPESVNLVQEWFGYCLTQDTSHDKILLVVGPPRSGKGTLADTLTALIGEENRCSSTLSDLSGRFGLQPLIDATIAVVGDARLSGRTDVSAIVERLLSISGSDPQEIDRKGISPVKRKLRARFMLLTNELPNLRDASGAMASRFLVIETTKSFLNSEDKTLKSDLQSPHLLPGILNWAIDGYRSLSIRGGFKQPASSTQTLSELEELTSPVKAFVNDCCEVEKNSQIDADEIYRAYVAWCERDGRPPQSRAIFGRDLHSCAHVRKKRVSNGAHRAYFYSGISLAGATKPF